MAPIIPERRKRRIEGREPTETFIHPPSSSKEGTTTNSVDDSLFLAVPVTVTDHDDGCEKRNDPSISPAKKARLTTNLPSNHHPPAVPSVAIGGTPRHGQNPQPVARGTPNGGKMATHFTLARSGAKTPSAQKSREESFDTNIETGYRFSSSLLGEGGFSKVRQGVHVKTGIKVAIKCMERARLGPDEPRVKTEIQALKTLGRHENIARLYQVVETPTRIFLVMELCSGGELFDFIVKSGRLSEQVTRIILNQILQALSFIHSRGFAHRDLKPENILLSSVSNTSLSSHNTGSKTLSIHNTGSKTPSIHNTGPKTPSIHNTGPKTGRDLDRQYEQFRIHPEDIRVKLIDFGLAADCSGSSTSSGSTCSSCGPGGIESLSTCCGSPAYAAPELISGSGSSYSGRKIDVWSTGIISFACLAGKLPFQDDSSLSALYKLILSGSYSVPAHVSPVARNFIASMLQVDPEKRAPVAQLLAHPFLQECSGSSSNSLSEPFPVKVSEENLSEEILWFLHNKFFPEVPLRELRRNIRSKFGYQTASYWLLKDHPYLHESPSSLHSSALTAGSSKKPDTSSSLHSSALTAGSSKKPDTSSSLQSSALTAGSAKKPMSPKSVPSEVERVRLFSRFQHPKDSTPSSRPRRDTAAPSPAVHFLSVPAPSPAVHFLSVPVSSVPVPTKKSQDARVVNEMILSSDPTVKEDGKRRPSTSPGHALSPLHNLNNVSIWNQSPRHFEDRNKVKRPLFVSTGKQEGRKGTSHRGGSVERLLSTPQKTEKEGAGKEAATTGKKAKKGNKIIGLIRHKLFH